MASSPQNRYFDVRKKLIELNYTESFGIDAVDLIEHLLVDLLSTTQSYQLIQTKENKLVYDLTAAQAQLFPIRKENVKLHRENNQLHLDNIKIQDELRILKDGHDRSIRVLQDQLQEMKLILDTKNIQYNLKDQELEKMRTALDQMTNASMQQKIVNSKVIKMTSSLTPSVPPSAISQQQQTREGGDDHDIIQSLRSQLDQANEILKSNEAEIQRLQDALQLREHELLRISKSDLAPLSLPIEGTGDPTTQPLVRHDHQVTVDVMNKRIIQQLNGQVDFLNEQLALREAQLRESDEQLNQFHQLQVEVRSKYQMVEKLTAEKEDLLSRIQGLQQKLEEQEVSLRHQVHPTIQSDAVTTTMERDHMPSKDAPHRHVMTIPMVQKESNSFIPSHPPRSSSSSSSAKVNGKVDRGTKKPTPRGKSNEDGLIVDLNAEIELLTKKLTLCTKMNKNLDEELTMIRKEKDDLMNELHGLRSQMSPSQRLDEEIKKLKEQLIQADMNYSRSRSNYEDSKEQVLRIQSEYQLVRKQLNQVQDVHQDLQRNYDINTQQIGLYKESMEKLRSELSEERRLNSELRLRQDDLVEESRRYQEQSEKYYDQFKTLQEESMAKDRQINQLMDQMAKIESNIPPDVLFDALKSHTRSVETQLDQVHSENIRLRDDQEKLNHFLDIVQQGNVKDGLLQLRKEKDHTTLFMKMQDILEKKEEMIVNQMKKIKELENEMKRSNLMKESGQKGNDSLKIELESRLRRMNQQEDLIEEQREEIQLLQHRQYEMDRDISNYSERIEEYSGIFTRTTDQLNAVRQELISLHETNQQLVIEKETLATNYETIQHQLQQLDMKYSSDQRSIRQLMQEKEELTQRINDLMLLLSNHESNVRVEVSRKTRIQEKVDQLMDQLDQKEKEINKLQQKCLEKDKKIEIINESLQNLDQTRDGIQEELDTYQVELERSQEVMDEMKRKIEEYQKLNEKLEKEKQGHHKEWVTSQRSYQSLEAMYHALELSCHELQHQLSIQQREVGGASEDLMLMTRENQQLTSELASACAERERLRKRVTEVIQAMTTIEQSRRSLEIEKEDLLETYRKVLQERRKLEEDLANLSGLRQQDVVELQNVRVELSELRSVVQLHGQLEARWIHEKSALTSQLEHLNDQLLREQRKLEAVEADNRRMMNDGHGLRQTNTMLNERINMIIKRATAATDANQLLTTRLNSVERERDAVRSLVELERQRATEMVQVAEAARIQAATKDLQIQRLKVSGVLFPNTSSSNVLNTNNQNNENVSNTMEQSTSS